MQFSLSKKLLFVVLMVTGQNTYGMEFIEETDIIVPEIYIIRDDNDGILPILDLLEPQQLIMGRCASSLKPQGGRLDLEDYDIITSQSFKELWREKAVAGLPLLVCRVSTIDKDGNSIYKHFFSTDVLKWFYGADFPETVVAEGKTNPINKLEPYGEIDIYLAKLGTSTLIPYIRLGSDLDIIRKTKTGRRVANILSLSTPESKLFLEGAENLIKDTDPYIQSTALLHNGIHWIGKGKEEKNATKYRKGLERLIEAKGIADGNHYAQINASYEVVKVLNFYENTSQKNQWLRSSLGEITPTYARKNMLNYLDTLTKQALNALIQERALTLKACIMLEKTPETLRDLESVQDAAADIFKHIAKDGKSPTKKAFANLQIAIHHTTTEGDREEYFDRAASSSSNNYFTATARLLAANPVYNEEAQRQLTLLDQNQAYDNEEAASPSLATAGRLSLFNN